MISFELYKDSSNEYRWRIRAANGKIIADSAEGYSARADCERGIELVKTGAASAQVKDNSGA